jgi:ribosomal protein L37AE/L43A
MIEIKEQYRQGPICPFCEAELTTLYLNQIRSVLGKRFIYSCSKCRKVLGISHRKGFWMG